jgi:hypothetical protein
MPASLTKKQQFWLNRVKSAEASGLSYITVTFASGVVNCSFESNQILRIRW